MNLNQQNASIVRSHYSFCLLPFSVSLTVFSFCLFPFSLVAEEPKPPWERLLVGDDAKLAQRLEAQIAQHEAADRYDDAIQAAEELLTLRKKVQGEDHWQAKNAEFSLGDLRKVKDLPKADRASIRQAAANIPKAKELIASGMYSEAMALIRQTLESFQTALGEDRLLTATAHFDLGFTLNLVGRYADAAPEFERALEFYQKKLGDLHPLTATAYNNLALSLHRQGKYAEATPIFQKGLEIRRKVLGDEHPETASSFNNVAFNLNERGRYAEATPLLRRALEVRRKTLGENHPETAFSYDNLAANLSDQANYLDAAPLFQKALDIRSRVLGDEHPDTASSYNNLGRNLGALGRHAEAAPVLEAALHSRRKVLGDEHPDTAESYDSVAVNLNVRGKYAEATPLFQKALDVRRKVLGEQHSLTAQSYNNLARNLDDLGKNDEAALLLQKSLEIYRKVFGDEHRDTAAAYDNLAANLNAQGKYEEATLLYRKALEIRRKALSDGHPLTAASYNNLATNLIARRNYAEARPLLQKAIEIRRATLGEHHPDTATSYSNLAASLILDKDAEQALTVLESAVRSYEACRLSGASRSVERALHFRGTPYQALCAVLAGEKRGNLAWSALEADLARGLLDEEAHRRVHAASADEEKRRLTLLEQRARLQPRILSLATNEELTDQEHQELRRLVKECAAIDKEMTELAVAISQRQVAGLAQVQAAIPADAALLCWLDLRSIDGDFQEHWGCVVRSRGEPAWERLPGTGDDKKWIKKDAELPLSFRSALSDSVALQPVADLAKRLAAQRLVPLEKHLEGVKHLLVIGVTDMAGVPVEALTDKYRISYVPSGTFLAKLKDKKRPGDDATLLALGDPLFELSSAKPKEKPLPPGGFLITQVIPGGNAAKARLAPGDVLLEYAGQELKSLDQLKDLIQANLKQKTVTGKIWRETEKEPTIRGIDPGPLGVALAKDPAPQAIAERRKTDDMLARAARGGDWNELPGTRVEITRLQKLFGEKNTVVLADSSASEQKLKELADNKKLHDFRYLHFATHGQANDVKAFESMLVLAKNNLPKDRPGPSEWCLNGELTANEVLEHFQLDAELVTLSACESALGRTAGGDGLLGFAQAFLLAGSRSVCLSLWKVDDTATALLMDRFYQNLLGRRAELKGKPMPKAEALAEAKRWLCELSEEQAVKLCAGLTNGVARGKGQKALEIPEVPKDPEGKKGAKPYAHPRYWAAFILIGDPE